MNSRFFAILLFLLAAIALAEPIALRAETASPYITEFDPPTPSSGPLAIAVDRLDNVWFTESKASKLAVFFPTNRSFREITVSSTLTEMWGLAHDPNGRVWFTAHEPETGHGYIAYYDRTSGVIRTFGVSEDNRFPIRLVYGPDGNIWFTAFNGNSLGKFEPSLRRITTYPVPESSSGPVGLTFDQSGHIWLSLALKQAIASFDPETATFTIYRPDFPINSPVGIAVDSNGMIWFADHGGSAVIRFDPSKNQFEQFPTTAPPKEIYPLSIPNDIKVTRDGNVWFPEHGGNKIAWLDPNSKLLIEYHVPTGPIATVFWLDIDSARNVWFTEYDGNKIGKLAPVRELPFFISLNDQSLKVAAGGSLTTTMRVEARGASSVSLRFQASETGIGLHANFNPPEWSGSGAGSVEIQLSAEKDVKSSGKRIVVSATDGRVTMARYLDFVIAGAEQNPIQVPITLILAAVVVGLAAVSTLVLRMRTRKRE